MRRHYLWLIAVALLLNSLIAYATATVATRLQGAFFVSHNASTLPSLTSVGLYNLNGVLQACGGADAGTCYPVADPVAKASGSVDGGTSVGAGAAAKIDTCSTGGSGTTCFDLKDVVAALKAAGVLQP